MIGDQFIVTNDFLLYIIFSSNFDNNDKNNIDEIKNYIIRIFIWFEEYYDFCVLGKYWIRNITLNMIVNILIALGGSFFLIFYHLLSCNLVIFLLRNISILTFSAIVFLIYLLNSIAFSKLFPPIFIFVGY